MVSRIASWSRLALFKDGFASSGQLLAAKGRCLAFQSETQHAKVIRALSTSNADDTKSQDRRPKQPATTKVLYDAECNICMHEIRLLQRLASQRPVDFVDINSLQFTPELFQGITYEMAMKEMHVIGADGKVHVRTEAVRHMYAACGMSWLSAITRLPGISHTFDFLYPRFAVYRLSKALDRCESGVSCSIKLKHLRDKLRAPPSSSV